jgi:hypothetical protein
MTRQCVSRLIWLVDRWARKHSGDSPKSGFATTQALERKGCGNRPWYSLLPVVSLTGLGWTIRTVPLDCCIVLVIGAAVPVYRNLFPVATRSSTVVTR